MRHPSDSNYHHHHRQNATRDWADACAEIHELLPAYSIGATDPAETALVEFMLPYCGDAAETLATYGAVAEGILNLVPDAGPPPPADQILQAVFDADEQMPAASAVHMVPATNFEVAEPLPFPGEPSNDQEDTNTPRIIYREPPVTSNRWLFPAAAAAMLAIVLLGIISLYLTVRFDDVQRSQAALLAALSEREADTVIVQAPPAATAVAVRSGDLHHRELNSVQTQSVGSMATILWDDGSNVGSLIVYDLPPLPEGQAYQLWLVNEDREVSLGQFHVDESGVGSMLFQSPEPIINFDVIGVSAEDIGGSTAPTSPHVITGDI